MMGVSLPWAQEQSAWIITTVYKIGTIRTFTNSKWNNSNNNYGRQSRRDQAQPKVKTKTTATTTRIQWMRIEMVIFLHLGCRCYCQCQCHYHSYSFIIVAVMYVFIVDSFTLWALFAAVFATLSLSFLSLRTCTSELYKAYYFYCICIRICIWHLSMHFDVCTAIR